MNQNNLLKLPLKFLQKSTKIIKTFELITEWGREAHKIFERFKRLSTRIISARKRFQMKLMHLKS
jgi:hypothetical protein